MDPVVLAFLGLPGGHFVFNGWWGGPGGEQVPLTPLGWYFRPRAAENLYLWYPGYQTNW